MFDRKTTRATLRLYRRDKWPFDLPNQGNLKMAMKDKPASAGEKLLYAIPEAAKLTSISRSTLYAEMGAGRLAAVKIGARRLIPADALRAWAGSRPAA